MALNLEQKQQIVSEVAAVAATAHSAIAAEYRGLSVAEMTALRAQAREANVCLRVVKNTLAYRAVEGSEFECMRSGFVGPLVLAFSRDDPGAAPRLVRDFAKTHNRLNTQMIAMGGQLMDDSALERLANLPTRDQALSQLMAVIKAPIEKLARTLAEPHAKLARTLAALREQKQSPA